MSDQQGVRPSQVTMGAWVAVVGCALLVLTLFDEVSRLRTVEYRDAIDDFLSTPPGNGLGLDSTQVVELMHWLMLFSGAVAAAALVLAVYVLQRSRAARVGYTIAAVAIVLTAPVSGGLAPVLVAFAAIMLWTKPARDWFAGVPAHPRTPASDRVTGPRTPTPRVEGSVMSSQNDSSPDQPEPRMPEDPAGRPTPPPTQGFGTPAAGQQGQPGQQGQQGAPGQPGSSYPPGYPGAGQAGPSPYGQSPHYGQQPPYGYPPQPYPYAGPGGRTGGDERPVTVTAAAWITWALSGLTILFFVLMGLFLAVAGNQVMDQVRDELAQDPNFSDFDVATDQVFAAFWVMAVLMVFWAVVAIVLAWFAYRRASWARITLVVSAAVALLVSLATFPVGLLHTLGAGAVIALLFAGGANEWYARGGGGSAGPGQPGGYPPYGNQPGYTGAPPQQQHYAPPGPQPGPPPGPPPGQQSQPPGPPSQPPARQGDRPDDPSDPKKDEPPSNVW